MRVMTPGVVAAGSAEGHVGKGEGQQRRAAASEGGAFEALPSLAPPSLRAGSASVNGDPDLVSGLGPAKKVLNQSNVACL